MRHVRCKICPNSMFQKWQLWTKLHKFEKTAQLAALGRARAHRESWPGPPQLNTIWDNSGTKLETATVSTKFEGPRDGQERTKEAEGWLAWPRNTLCVSIYRVSRVTCDGPRWCQMCQSPQSLKVGWEEGGIFRLLKVHLLHFQQVPVSNEGNDECFWGDELAGVGRLQ